MAKPEGRSAESAGVRTVRRGLLLGGILALWTVCLFARLCDLQIVHYMELLARAQRQQQRIVEVAPERGTIYDRQMNPLAMSLAVDSICAVPSEIPDRPLAAKLLAQALGLDAGELLERWKAFHSFSWVKRKVSAEEANRVRALDLKGIYFQKEMKRFFPKGELASHVLGYVGLDDDGLAGLEYEMNDLIKGRPGRVLVAADARHQSIESSEWEGQPGQNVVLTLDQNLQFIAEKALEEAYRKWHAAGGTAIVQNPNNGEILAMASRPTFNSNDYVKSNPAARINRAISWVYEPGSTFKLVTLSAALEENLTNSQEVIDCQEGSIVIAGHVIHDHKPFGALTTQQVLVESSDVGAIKFGLRLGEERFYDYIQKAGFGSKTEIRLPGEERGLLKPPSRWSGISLAEMSIGQEVGITPIQLITAYSAIANGGTLNQPRIVRDIYRGAEHLPLPPPAARRVVSERTARIMREMLTEVVEQGTGIPARLEGYTAAGKTGTAQMIDASGTYSKTHYIASFVGFAPVEKPAVTILVAIDSPVGAIYGSEVAAPVFRSIAEQTLGYLNVPQDNPSRWLQVATSAPAGFPRQTRGNRVGILPPRPERLGVAALPVQQVSYSVPPALRPLGTIVLDGGTAMTMPDFSGMPVREVARQCQAMGLEPVVRGSGLAVEQAPLPGSRVTAGAQIRVVFAR